METVYSKRVNTLILPEVKEQLDTITPVLNGRHKYKTSIVEWLKPIIDLSGFHIYPMNGITHTIDWVQKTDPRGIYMHDGDYEWVQQTGDELRYISCPNSVHGNHVDIPTDVPVILDLAYVGAAKPQPIPMTPNIEKVFYSLSKPFGVHNIRTGWYFTRRPDARLHMLNIDAGYYNHCATQYAEHIINNFEVSHPYDRWRDLQVSACEANNLTPSETVWLGTSLSEEFKEYRRDGKIARICITELLKGKF